MNTGMNTRTNSILAALALALPSLAGNVTITVSPPTHANPAPVMVRIGVQEVFTVIHPGMTAEQKRDAIAESLVQAGRQVTVASEGPSLEIHNLPAGTPVRFFTHVTGEERDSLVSPASVFAVAGFSGPFDAFSAPGVPAIFTAGIVTDMGELTARISAEELNFQTDGPIICQALFQRLAPRAPLYGAQINYAGDRLEIYFDPAYTVTQGGVIFGTTSLSPGCAGVLNVGEWTNCPADFNRDGQVDFFDYLDFVFAYDADCR